MINAVSDRVALALYVWLSSIRNPASASRNRNNHEQRCYFLSIYHKN